MSEQHTAPASTPNDLRPVQFYIQQHTPWLVILGVVGEPPMLAVKDSAHRNLCIGFRTQADVTAYLSMFGIPDKGHHHG
jgi:hypothetical protein